MSNYANKEYIIKVGDNPDITGGYPLKEKPIELVRCKDCRHWESEDGKFGLCKICHSVSSSNGWFCADGEKRSD